MDVVNVSLECCVSYGPNPGDALLTGGYICINLE